jgi:hypothetical protein
MPPEGRTNSEHPLLRPRRPAGALAAPSADSPGPPEGLAARILELGEELRREGVAVGTSELLDAFAVLREVPWT